MHKGVKGNLELLSRDKIKPLVDLLNKLAEYAKDVERARSQETNSYNFEFDEVRFYLDIYEEINNYSIALASWINKEELVNLMQNCFDYLVDVNGNIRKKNYRRQ